MVAYQHIHDLVVLDNKESETGKTYYGAFMPGDKTGIEGQETEIHPNFWTNARELSAEEIETISAVIGEALVPASPSALKARKTAAGKGKGKSK